MAKEKKVEETKKVEEKKGFSVLGVYVNGNKKVEYSVAMHGDRTQEYAEEYAKKIGGEVRKVA